ncbi:11085_t:CDS:2, partial [Rhizophagus irregularis]
SHNVAKCIHHWSAKPETNTRSTFFTATQMNVTHETSRPAYYTYVPEIHGTIKETLKYNSDNAPYFGTSVHKFHRRRLQIDYLDSYQERHHNRMTSWIHRRHSSTNPKVIAKAERDYSKFTLSFKDHVKEQAGRHYRSDHSDTSDDTKTLEARPLKRAVYNTTNLDHNRHHAFNKKAKRTLSSIETGKGIFDIPSP